VKEIKISRMRKELDFFEGREELVKVRILHYRMKCISL
jgi:hypothetical protein